MTLFNLWKKVLGTYAGVVASDLLITSSRNKEPQKAELRGKRLVITGELEEGSRLSVGNLKRICSTDNINAEAKYKDPMDFEPTHTLILFTNYLPKVGSMDSGTWSRLVTVPFLDIDSTMAPAVFTAHVRAICGEDNLSDWVSVTVDGTDTCRPVENLQFVRTGRRAGTLTWIPDTLQTLWQVSVGLVGGDVSEAFFDTIVTAPFLDIDSSMAPTVFTAHVRAICGEDNLSDWVSVTADPYESIAQAVAPDVQLVPNPADGLVRVVSSDGLRGIEVYDMTGRRMLAFTATSTEVSFNVSDWSAGAYIVILRTIAGASVQRLVVE